MASSSLTTPVLRRGPCRPSTDVVFTSRYAKRIFPASSTTLSPPKKSTTVLITVAGNSRQLGLPVQQLQQGGYLEPFPHLRGRFEQ